MSATDLIFTPIGRQRSELCSILCSGDRFWPFYNFQFLVSRIIFPLELPIRSRRKTKFKFFSPISAPWPSRWLSWVSANAPWKMSATDAMFTPIDRQRGKLCSILISGDRFWPFYNFQLFRWSRKQIFQILLHYRGGSDLCCITVAPK